MLRTVLNTKISNKVLTMKLRNCIPFILLLITCQSMAEVTITDAWVRENAPGQKIGAAYMTLKSPEDTKLVYVEAAAVAGSVEIHSMTMNNGVMKMRMLEELTLEANKPASLKPGSFHLMMLDLKKPLKAGEKVTFRLCFEDKNGKITDQSITLPIKSQ
jgi:periplasmic copper chaperone A